MKEIITKEYKKSAVKFKSAFDKKGYVSIDKKYCTAYAKLCESLDKEQIKLLVKIDTAKEQLHDYAIKHAFTIGFKAGVNHQ